MNQSSRLALTFIFITAFVDSIGFGIIIPVLPLVIAELTGEGMAAAADYGGWLGFAFAGMLFLFSPLIGNLSDRFGRRPVLITSLLALGVDYLITGFAPTIAWLFVGRILAGISGASYTTANAYIADVSPPEKRAANFGLVGAAFSLGFIAGPVIGGFLGEYGSRVPFFVSAGLSVANALFGLLVLRESLPKENRRTFEWQRANPLSALLALRRFPVVVGMIGIFILMRLAHDANPAVFTYYVMLKFDWGPREVGYSMMFVGLCMAVVYGWLTRVTIPKLGETRSAYLGLVCGAIGFTGYAFASEGWMIYGWMLVWSLMGFAMPALNAIMSEQVGPSEQGELQGALASVGGLTSVVAPPLLTHIFSYFSSVDAPIYFPGAAFLTAGSFMAIAALLLTRVRQDSSA
jgi:DHA1 family tetracycline resistance protein-like MFS transporter